MMDDDTDDGGDGNDDDVGYQWSRKHVMKLMMMMMRIDGDTNKINADDADAMIMLVRN